MKFVQFVLDKVNLSVISVVCTQTKDSDKNFWFHLGICIVCWYVLSSENYVSAIQYSLSAYLLVIWVFENSQ